MLFVWLVCSVSAKVMLPLKLHSRVAPTPVPLLAVTVPGLQVGDGQDKFQSREPERRLGRACTHTAAVQLLK